MRIHSSKDLGALVRDRRKSSGWTQAELAERANVKPLWISQFERGKSTAQVGLVLRTFKALGIELWTQNPSPQSPTENFDVIDLDALLDTPTTPPSS